MNRTDFVRVLMAACLAGVITVRDAMTLVALRGRLFETLPQGGMLSVPLPAAEARELMGPELSIAAINAPALCVLAGPRAAIARAEDALRARDVECTRVHINVAAHSAMVRLPSATSSSRAPTSFTTSASAFF